MQHLTEHVCTRCQYHWWPRQVTTPKRCARCKSPYWNRPRQQALGPSSVRHQPRVSVDLTGLSETILAKLEPDRSMKRAMAVLKEMKQNQTQWAEMLERIRQEFDVELTKDQVKALVR